MKEREGVFPPLGVMHMERSQWANVEYIFFFFLKKKRKKEYRTLVLFRLERTKLVRVLRILIPTRLHQ